MKICPTCQIAHPDNYSVCPDDGARLIAQPTETEALLAAGLSRRFRLVGRLGKGGFGTVFLAEQIGMITRLVALKVLNRKLLDEPEFLARFQIEASSTGRIHHANVVTIYEAAQADDGTPYIAMEYLEGVSLREVLKQRGALPVTEVAEILQQTARGLKAAHKLGIIHRDLKPDNIFLTHGDEGELIVKVVDFGIAKLRESGLETQTGTFMGTPAYTSYEQASGVRGSELAPRSDVYSLGVVVYEMLTGRLPFQSDTTAGFLRKHLLEEPPPFGATVHGEIVPPEVEAVVMKALKKEAKERYQSAMEFAQAFVAAATPVALASLHQPLQTTEVVLLPDLRKFDTSVPQTAIAQANPEDRISGTNPNLIKRFWEYRRTEFGHHDDYFDRPLLPTARPPVFKKEHASRNVLLKDAISEPMSIKVLKTIPEGNRHKWFGSMASSQALTQSVFGNLTANGKLDCLRALVGDDGKPLFIWELSHSINCQLEFKVDYLGEKRLGRTSLDVVFDGNHRIAVECKLSEQEAGSCSRPRLDSDDTGHCNGSYMVQGLRKSRCSLTEIGVKYWSYIPELFNWSAEIDHDPCPINFTYQLVRNLLAVCVDPTGRVSLDSGHVVMLYDERNPSFYGEGNVITAWNKVRGGLKQPSLMQKCTWQEIVVCLRGDSSLNWLATALARKYGF